MNIFRSTLDPQTLVTNYYDFSRRVWDLKLMRAPNDWEVGEMIILLELLGNLNLVPDCGDRWWTWKLNRKRLLYFQIILC